MFAPALNTRLRINQTCGDAHSVGEAAHTASSAPGYASPEGELMDLTMMVMNGGRERTIEEFSAIFSAAGFRLVSATRTATPLCLIEGVIDGG